MAAERSCAHPFIRRVQAVLKETGSLRASFGEIRGYQSRARKIYRVDVHCIHALTLSTCGLAALAMYEYLRYRGVPLPDSRSIIRSIMPAKNRSEQIITGAKDDDRRHEAMGKDL
jgi:hypothetical protein